VDVGRARKALGNAVVPACAEVIGRAIMEAIG
jgi:site-specific DNA-cytosine methylase